MAWDTVDSGEVGNGSFVIERRVYRMPVPGSVSRLPIQLRSYRWQVTGTDGTVSKSGTAKSLDAARALVLSLDDESASEAP